MPAIARGVPRRIARFHGASAAGSRAEVESGRRHGLSSFLGCSFRPRSPVWWRQHADCSTRARWTFWDCGYSSGPARAYRRTLRANTISAPVSPAYVGARFQPDDRSCRSRSAGCLTPSANAALPSSMTTSPPTISEPYIPAVDERRKAWDVSFRCSVLALHVTPSRSCRNVCVATTPDGSRA